VGRFTRRPGSERRDRTTSVLPNDDRWRERNGDEGHGQALDEIPDIDSESHPDGAALAAGAGFCLRPQGRGHDAGAGTGA